ncbi:MAG TPA: nicotinate (nicotinamide) nucleotide adenylyltransferase [Taishania sp.]|nr:nicotinate (nicotinamide) nucleotide adenylyltransferase [Taishania sp.]
MKVGLYFGSFNPIHIGHLIIANHIVQYSDLEQIWFVVSPHNPLKEKKTLLKDYHRLALVKEAIEDNPKFRASDIEFGLQQPSYTVKTLVALEEKYPNFQFSIIMGEDNLKTLHKWYNYEYLLNNYQIFVYPRATSSQEQASKENSLYKFINHQHINILKDVPVMNISSTFIRNAIKNGMDVQYLLPPPVLKYIDEMGFYR